jgi:hypothetical protein
MSETALAAAPTASIKHLPRLRVIDGVAMVSFFVVAMALFYMILQRTTAVAVENTFFGADAVENFKALQVSFYRTLGINKHAAAVVVYAVLVEGLRAAGVAAATATILAAAFLSAAAVAVIYAVLRCLGGAPAIAAALTLLFVASHGVLTVFGVVETYALTVAAMALGILIARMAADLYPSRPVVAAAIAGLAAGAAALCNPPAGAVILIYLVLVLTDPGRSSLGDRIRNGLLALALALMSGGVVLGLLRWNSFSTFVTEYSQQYTSLSHFLEADKILSLLTGVFMFAFVAPFDHPTPANTHADLALLAQSPLRLLALGGVVLLLAATAIVLARGVERRFTLGLLAVLGALLVFYTYFNPAEIMLYVSQTTLVMIVLMVLAFGARPRAAVPIAVLAVLLVVVNIGAVWV